MAIKLRGIIKTAPGRRLVRLGKKVDGCFCDLFQKNMEGIIPKDVYSFRYLAWYDSLQSFHEEIDGLWEKFVTVKNENDLHVYFNHPKKKKKRQLKPFVVHTDIGEKIIRLSFVLDNMQVLLTSLALSKIISPEQVKVATDVFYTRIKKLETEMVKLEKVKADGVSMV